MPDLTADGQELLEQARQNQLMQLINMHREFWQLWTVKTANTAIPPNIARHLYDGFLAMAEALVPFLPPPE